MLVPLASPMAWSHGTQNMVVVSGKFGGDVVFSGHGAGGEPTAVGGRSCVVAVGAGPDEGGVSGIERRGLGGFFVLHLLPFFIAGLPGIVYDLPLALAVVRPKYV